VKSIYDWTSRTGRCAYSLQWLTLL